MIHCCHISLLTFLLLFFVGSMRKKQHCLLRYSESDAEHESETIDNGASNGAFDNDENSNVLRRNPLTPLSVGDVRNQQCRSSGKNAKKRHRIDYAGSDGEHSQKRRAGKRVKWSDGELQALRISFKKFFALRKPPDNGSIEKAMRRFPCFKERSIPQIKSRAWHLIQTGR
jgi:hypothetical protein